MKNPKRTTAYGLAKHLLSESITWDIKPTAWKNRRRISKLKGKYKGGKAVILCNGPSLNRVDFKLLDDVYVFGLNKINLLFDRESFRPDSIVSMNRLVLEQNAEFFNSTDIDIFISSRGAKSIDFRKNTHYLQPVRWDRVMGDVSWGIVEGYTVTCTALQLAFHMGFESVGLVGCDHNFSRKGSANSEGDAVGADPDHFDPNYFSNVKWHFPDLPACEYFYYRCREMYARAGRSIFNCTVGGKLELFPRKSLAEFRHSK